MQSVAHTSYPDALPIRSFAEEFSRAREVLIVDDQPEIRRVCRRALETEDIRTTEAGSGLDALRLASERKYDLILLDVDMPGMTGEKVMTELRRKPPAPHLKVIMISGRATGDDLSRMMLAGADDFLTKPFTLVQLRARVQSALRLKAAQDRAEHLNRQLHTVNAELERILGKKDGELFDARGALVLAMAKLVERRSQETGPHLLRMKRYVRILADAAALRPAFAPLLEGSFRQSLEEAAPLHDIGKVGVPDSILNKPGSLTDWERTEMQRHTIYGAETLAAVAANYHFATGFLNLAIDLARSHHEHYDGRGYPDGLSGDAIPLAARLLAIADVYDAVRSHRVYKDPCTHAETVQLIQSNSAKQFDPALVDVFLTVTDEFEKVFAGE